jgi:tetratricopeptide (TPR) repeat protein
VIQPPPTWVPRRLVGVHPRLAALAVCLLAGCAGQQGPKRVEEAPATRAQRFVPAFAYEAYVRGELALAQGHPQEAAQQLELATAAPDEDAYLLSRLAEAQRQSGDTARALSTLEEAERVDACAESLWLTRGEWSEQARDLPAAARAYARAVACAPGSERGVLALARLWSEGGEPARALELLAERAGEPSLAGAKAALARALGAADSAEVRFALDSWLSLGAPDAATYRGIAERALTREEYALALALTELPATPVEALLRARLLVASAERGALRALLAQHHESELGGPERAAELALSARDFERTDLYASLSLGRSSSDAALAARAQARQALGQHEAALEDARAIGSPALRRKLARAQLEALGLSALARELEMQR